MSTFLFRTAITPMIKTLCSSRKNPYPSHGRSLEIPRGRGVLKLNFWKQCMKINWNFLREGGGGIKNKNPSVGEYGYFLELHIALKPLGSNHLLLKYDIFTTSPLKIHWMVRWEKVRSWTVVWGILGTHTKKQENMKIKSMKRKASTQMVQWNM